MQAGVAVFAILMLAFGVFCLAAPHKIQAFYLKWARFGFQRRFMQSKEYIASVRAVGIGAVILAFGLIYALGSAR